MNDELTPQEKEAIANLPRERMPAGLEDRVVAAMQARGFVARRRRVIELSNSRVAALLAASVVMIIGAYSIGLQRGDAGDTLRSAVTEPSAEREKKVEESTSALSTEATVPLVVREESAERQDVQASKRAREPASPAPQSAPQPEQKATAPEDLARESDAQANVADEVAGAGTPAEERAPETEQLRSAVRPSMSLSDSGERAQSPVAFSRTGRGQEYTLGGSSFLVEAPDSVRVIQDAKGRMLIIYTSDGIIRIRLADTRR